MKSVKRAPEADYGKNPWIGFRLIGSVVDFNKIFQKMSKNYMIWVSKPQLPYENTKNIGFRLLVTVSFCVVLVNSVFQLLVGRSASSWRIVLL